MFHPDLREAMATALKQKNMHAHQALEDLLIPRLHKINTVEGYVQLLKTFYGYFGPLEKSSDNILPHINYLTLEQGRNKSGREFPQPRHRVHS